MKNMNEEILFNLIQGNLIPDAIRNDEFHVSDLTSEHFNLDAEMKCISKHYGRVMIERKKWDELFALPGNKKLRYIVSTPKGVWSFDLRKIVVPDDWWNDVWIGNASTHYHRNIDGTYKNVAFLPLGWAKNITKRINYPTV
jgi:hypothetical protein